jgi:NADH:ubiquinone oxidoreductase subunit K
MNISKTTILPIVSAILFFVGTVTNHKFTADSVDFYATIVTAVVLFAINMYGIFKSHKKKGA